MKRIIYLISLAILSSCASSKFDFKNAYKYNKYNYKNTNESQSVKSIQAKDPQLLTSIKPSIIQPEMNSIEITNKIVPDEKLKTLLSKEKSKLTTAEKKVLRKELRTELIKAKKEYKAYKKAVRGEDATKAMNKWVYTGIIVGAAGILLLIFGVGLIGALALVVGVGFIVYGLLLEGGVIG